MFKTIPSEEYLENITNLIKKSKNTIYIQAMYFCFDDSLKGFVEELIGAKKRGVDVKLNIDNYSVPYNNGHKYLIHIKKENRIKCVSAASKSKNYLNMLIENGVDINFINQYKYGKFLSEYIPFLGRNHMKITLIDDVSFIGGINFSSKSFNYSDFMIRTENKDMLSALKKIFIDNRDNKKQNDKKIKINDRNILLVDSGKARQSIIYESSIECINNAKESIRYISQFFPDFKILDALENAVNRGVNVEIITHSNEIAEKKYRHKIEKILFNISNSNISNVYENSDRYIHAKMMIIDKDTSSPSVILGSHNFSTFGVLFGTAEISIYSKEKDLISELYIWYSNIKIKSNSLIRFHRITESVKQ